jgi:hypothetical protein
LMNVCCLWWGHLAFTVPPPPPRWFTTPLAVSLHIAIGWSTNSSQHATVLCKSCLSA